MGLLLMVVMNVCLMMGKLCVWCFAEDSVIVYICYSIEWATSGGGMSVLNRFWIYTNEE